MQTADPLELPTHTSTLSLSELAQEHSMYDQRLEALRAKTHLTEEEMMEEVKLKKLKLSLKDRMEQIRRQTPRTQ